MIILVACWLSINYGPQLATSKIAYLPGSGTFYGIDQHQLAIWMYRRRHEMVSVEERNPSTLHILLTRGQHHQLEGNLVRIIELWSHIQLDAETTAFPQPCEQRGNAGDRIVSELLQLHLVRLKRKENKTKETASSGLTITKE